MRLTVEEARSLYLSDLKIPDVHTLRPKVKHISHWENIKSTANPQKIDVFDTSRNIFCLSDTHFGHTNIIKYCNRPFPTSELMTACMIGNYQKVVKPDDIVIFGGDVGFMSETKINEVLDQLPGYKIQIVGNHDIHRDGKLYDLNFDERHLCMLVDVIDHDLTYQLFFTHYPLTFVPENTHNVHGHIHHHTMGGPRTNISVEHTNFTPKNIKDLLPTIRESMLTTSMGAPHLPIDYKT